MTSSVLIYFSELTAHLSSDKWGSKDTALEGTHKVGTVPST